MIAQGARGIQPQVLEMCSHSIDCAFVRPHGPVALDTSFTPRPKRNGLINRDPLKAARCGNLTYRT